MDITRSLRARASEAERVPLVILRGRPCVVPAGITLTCGFLSGASPFLVCVGMRSCRIPWQLLDGGPLAAMPALGACRGREGKARKTSMAEELQQKTGRYGCEFDCGFTSDEFDAVVQHEHVSCQAFQVD